MCTSLYRLWATPFDIVLLSCRDVTVLVLDRPRHAQLIKEIRAAGARIRMISDGDVSLTPLGCLSLLLLLLNGSGPSLNTQ